ncbi:MAG: PEGA domain-containing protein, partial [Polyangiales bacterium]
APPPIPVPPGIVTVGPAPPPQPRDAPATLLGMKVSAIPKFKPQVPTIPARPLPPSGLLVPKRADTAEPTRERGMDKQPLFDDVETPTPFDDTKKGLTPAPPPVPRARTRPSDAPTSEMSPLQADLLEEASVQPEAQLERVWRETSEFLEVKIENDESVAAADDPVAPMFAPVYAEARPPSVVPTRPGSAVPAVMHGRAGSVVEGDAQLPSLTKPDPVAPLPLSAPPPSTLDFKPLPKPRSKLPIILGVVLLVGGGAAVAAWQLMKSDGQPAGSGSGSGSNPVVKTPEDAAVVASATPDARAVPDASTGKPPSDAGATKPAIDAAQVAVAPADAAVVAPPVDAKVAAAPVDAGKAVTPTGNSDQLAITSTPAGARVYLDGSDTGVTPVKLPGSPDRHTIALLLPGHDLYIAQVDGHGTFAIPLKELTPTAGPAGIKVIKCKDKDRYYVFVDGKPTGMMCPTERIETDVGPHTVEVYDAVTEVKKKWDVLVKDTRLSARVKVE